MNATLSGLSHRELEGKNFGHNFLFLVQRMNLPVIQQWRSHGTFSVPESRRGVSSEVMQI